jgi:hypothetical protein
MDPNSECVYVTILAYSLVFKRLGASVPFV